MLVANTASAYPDKLLIFMVNPSRFLVFERIGEGNGNGSEG